jgi:hypothetical protein
VLELTLLLLQTDYAPSPERFFAAFFLILIIFCGALLFTYWIYKGE